jgi:hypothetical protein
LDDVFEAAGGNHVHSVDVSFAEEGSRNADNGGNADFHGLSKLALMTGVNVPLYVAVESGPPEAIENGASSGVDAFVTETIVSFTDDGESLGRGEIKLVAASRVASPELSVQ